MPPRTILPPFPIRSIRTRYVGVSYQYTIFSAIVSYQTLSLRFTPDVECQMLASSLYRGIRSDHIHSSILPALGNHPLCLMRNKNVRRFMTIRFTCLLEGIYRCTSPPSVNVSFHLPAVESAAAAAFTAFCLRRSSLLSFFSCFRFARAAATSSFPAKLLV